jgi:hypothetical protein
MRTAAHAARGRVVLVATGAAMVVDDDVVCEEWGEQ